MDELIKSNYKSIEKKFENHLNIFEKDYYLSKKEILKGLKYTLKNIFKTNKKNRWCI